jgi:AraC-like DNA-binding protein
MTAMSRYAALTGYVELGRALGIDPAALMHRVGLHPGGLAHPDRRVPAVAVAQLLEMSAQASGRDDFGLRLAELRTMSNLGPISLVLRDEPDARSVVELMIRYEHTYNESLRLQIVDHHEVAFIRVDLDFGNQAIDERQSKELVLGTLTRLLREFLGPDWVPVSVSLPHSAPPDLETHHRVLGSRLEFDQPFAGLVVYDADLDKPLPHADPRLRVYAHEMLRSLGSPKGESETDRVRRLVESLLPAGRCSAQQVARHLGVNRRTLHRRLATEGTTFTAVLDETRRSVAERLLLNTDLSVTEISQSLGFAAPSGMSRWFRDQYGCSPTGWLTEQQERATRPATPSDAYDQPRDARPG